MTIRDDSADRPAGVSRRAALGTAGVALSSVLTASAPLADAQTMAPGGPGTPGAAGASILFARDHGVVGDGRTDDTRAVQALLDRCAAGGGRIAHFGAASVRITGPLVSRGVGIIFDAASYGAVGAPGFVAEGRGYTVLTVTGAVADFCATVTGAGGSDISWDGRIDRDGRPRLDGIAFGSATEPFLLSTVRWARAHHLAGCGVRHVQCFDSTFLAVSVERCGRDDAYAFETVTVGNNTCNETVWVRLQVEQAIGRAIRIDPLTLSCSFLKIHSERAIAAPGAPTWLLGGACTFDNVRLQASNPASASVLILSGQADLRNLRAEGDFPVAVNATGGTVTFHNPAARLQPALNQNGLVNIVGGTVVLDAIGAGWTVQGSQVARLTAGFMPPGQQSRLIGCTVGELAPQPGATQGEIVLCGTRVDALATAAPGARLRALRLHGGSRATPAGTTLTCTDQLVEVDASSTIAGNVVVRGGALRLAGTITGTLTLDGGHDARAADGAAVQGPVRGWGPPTVAGTPGAWSANLAPQPAGARRAVAGWRYLGGAWRAQPAA